MDNKKSSFKKRVLESLKDIPYGKVTTYSSIAIGLSNKNLARAVGNALHSNNDPNKYPCYKVVNSKGCLSKHYAFNGVEGQKKLLKEEGIEVKDYKVDLKKYKI